MTSDINNFKMIFLRINSPFPLVLITTTTAIIIIIIHFTFTDKPLRYASQQLTRRTALDKPVLARRPSTTNNNSV